MLMALSMIPALLAASQSPLVAASAAESAYPLRSISTAANASITVLRATRIDQSDLREAEREQAQFSRDPAGTLWIEFP